MGTWKEDLAISRELNLDGVDCYQLRVFERSPLFKYYIANGKLPAGPNHELRALMFAEAVQSMREAGWSRLSISHWAANTRRTQLLQLLRQNSFGLFSLRSGSRRQYRRLCIHDGQNTRYLEKSNRRRHQTGLYDA